MTESERNTNNYYTQRYNDSKLKGKGKHRVANTQRNQKEYVSRTHREFDYTKPSYHDVLDSEVPLYLYNRKMTALLDTGATVNCLGTSVLNSFPQSRVHHKVPLRKPLVASTANKSKPVRFDYKVIIPITIFGRKFEIPFFVADDMQDQVILGVPFLRDAKVQIAYDNSHMYVCFNSQLKLETPETLPPMSEKVIMAKLHGKFTDSHDVLVQGNTMQRFTKKVVGGRTLVTTDPKRKLYPVLLSNISDKTVVLPKKQVVGHVLKVSKEDIMRVEKPQKEEHTPSKCRLGGISVIERRVQSASSRKANLTFNTYGANCRSNTEKLHQPHYLSHKTSHKKHPNIQKKYKHSVSPIQVNMSAQNQDLHTFEQDFTKMPPKLYKTPQVYEGEQENDSGETQSPIDHKLTNTILDESEKQELRELLYEFDDVFYHQGEPLPVCKGYTHKMRIDPDTKPWKPVTYRYNPSRAKTNRQKDQRNERCRYY